MISDPDLVRYACIAHRDHNDSSDPVILAEFNSADSSLQDLAHQCLRKAPPHHSVFSHSYRNQTYSFLFENPFIFFGIFDSNVPKSDQFRFLGRLKEVLHHLVRGNPNHHKFTPCCFQGELHPIFHKLMSESFDLGSLHLGSNGVHGIGSPLDVSGPVSGPSKGRKILSVPLFTPSKMGYKMKRFCGEGMSESKESLVDTKADFSDAGIEGDGKSREITGQNGVFYVDGGRQRATRIWRRHVWIVLTLDLAVCLILFGIWLFVCRGFECIER